MTTTDTTRVSEAAAPSAFAGAERAHHYIEQPDTPNPPAVEPEQVDSTVPGPDAVAPSQAEEIAPVEPAPLTDIDRDLSETAVPAAAPIAHRGIRALLGRAGIKIKPGAAELAELDRVNAARRDEKTIRQATWTRAVSILVANPKGGVGKTPTALLLGGTLATIRGGSVCIVEVSDDRGALTYRSEGHPQRGLGELVRDIAEIRSAGQLGGYTAPQSSFASVIGTVATRPTLGDSDVTAVAAVIDEYFAIRVMDSGNQTSSAAFRGALDRADVVVIPITNAGDAALEAAALLDTLRAGDAHSRTLADNAVIVRLHDGRPENPQVIARVDRILASYKIRAIHEIPFDGHIAERGQLTLGKLSPATREALTAQAAAVIRTLHTAVH